MNKIYASLVLIAVIGFTASAQTKPHPRAGSKPAATNSTAKSSSKSAVTGVDKGTIAGGTYTNTKFGFEISFPDTWLIPGDDFEGVMKSQGYDLSLKAPDTLTPTGKAAVNAALKRVSVLMTAYRSMPGTADNAIMRVSIKNLSGDPEVKDAVDYFDAMRASFKKLQLPADFRYSETQAEQLGSMQFAYLDASSKAGKKRMYATVRNGFAILFTLSYSSDADLATMRRVLEEGNFDLK